MCIVMDVSQLGGRVRIKCSSKNGIITTSLNTDAIFACWLRIIVADYGYSITRSESLFWLSCPAFHCILSARLFEAIPVQHPISYALAGL